MAICKPFNDAFEQSAFGGTGIQMGIGRLGMDDIVHKRKFRFLFSIVYCRGSRRVPPTFCRTAGRPSFTVEDTEINYLNEKTWIPGKATWEPITVTYYDVNAAENAELLSWIATVYDFTDAECRFMASKRGDYSGQAYIFELDGCGNVMTRWTLGDAWPTTVKFGDLDMNSSDVCEVECTMRYSKVKYDQFCGGGVVAPCACSPCYRK